MHFTELLRALRGTDQQTNQHGVPRILRLHGHGVHKCFLLNLQYMVAMRDFHSVIYAQSFSNDLLPSKIK